jgi:monomeric isocitrate dehydrogenase
MYSSTSEGNLLKNNEVDEDILDVINAQCHRELSGADVDVLYRILAKFGHTPADKKRARQALASSGEPLKQSATPILYDFS